MYKNFYLILIVSLQCLIHGLNKQKKIINIVYALNSRYIDYLYTSIYTLAENSSNNTIYHIYIQIGNGFDKDNIKVITNLEKKYFHLFFHFIDMKDDFVKAIKGSLDISTYYRLKLPILLPTINRMIHIDSDSIILKDLIELYTLNLDGKYILGRLDMIVSELDKLGVYTNTYINCGVILMDLYNLRKFKYVDKFLNYIKIHNNAKYLNHHDQTCLNYVCYDKIGLFRPKYHMWPFKNIEQLIDFNKGMRAPYVESEFIEDYKDPTIIHFPGHFKIEKEYFNTTFYILYKNYTDIATKLKSILYVNGNN